jgi:hypothetical protein
VCSAGKYQDREGQRVCVDCPRGKAIESRNAKICQLCTEGSYVASEGSERCTSCDAGTYQGLRGATDCVDTPVGTYSEIGAARPEECSSGTIADSKRNAFCKPCDGNSDSSEDRTRCVCRPGSYSGTDSTTTSVNCVPCPDGASCKENGVTFATMQTLSGWWRKDNDSLSFYRCLNPQHCIGGRGQLCGGHRTGPLCSLCEKGYQSSTGTSVCTECPSAGQALGVSVFIIFCICLVLIIM